MAPGLVFLRRPTFLMAAGTGVTGMESEGMPASAPAVETTRT